MRSFTKLRVKVIQAQCARLTNPPSRETTLLTPLCRSNPVVRRSANFQRRHLRSTYTYACFLDGKGHKHLPRASLSFAEFAPLGMVLALRGMLAMSELLI